MSHRGTSLVPTKLWLCRVTPSPCHGHQKFNIQILNYLKETYPKLGVTHFRDVVSAVKENSHFSSFFDGVLWMGCCWMLRI